MSAARLIAAVAVAGLIALVQLAAAPLSGGLPPSILDIAVGSAFAAAAVAVTAPRRLVPALLLGAGSVFWVLTSVAPLLPAPLDDAAARTSLLPHALLIAMISTLPSGRIDSVRARVLLVTPLAIGVLAGTGIVRPVLLLLGLAALAAAARAWRGVSSLIQIGVGVSFVAIDIGTASGGLGAAGAAQFIGLVLIVALASGASALDDGVDSWSASWVRDGDRGAEALDSRLAQTLRVPGLRAAFPSGRGPDLFVDVAGRAARTPVSATEVRSADGSLVAVLSPAALLDPFLLSTLISILSRAGDVARLRESQRAIAADIATSRRMLLQAADDEKAALKQRLRRTVGARIEAVIAELADLADADGLRQRAAEVLQEVVRAADGAAAPTGHDELVAGLNRIASASGVSLRCDIHVPMDLPPRAHRVIWYTGVEGIVNAAKHAPGAVVHVGVAIAGSRIVMTVEDNGEGGARPDGSGLRGLADRAADAGGSLVVASGATGTRLTLAVPVSGIPLIGERGSPHVSAAAASLGSSA